MVSPLSFFSRIPVALCTSIHLAFHRGPCPCSYVSVDKTTSSFPHSAFFFFFDWSPNTVLYPCVHQGLYLRCFPQLLFLSPWLHVQMKLICSPPCILFSFPAVFMICCELVCPINLSLTPFFFSFFSMDSFVWGNIYHMHFSRTLLCFN